MNHLYYEFGNYMYDIKLSWNFCRLVKLTCKLILIMRELEHNIK